MKTPSISEQDNSLVEGEMNSSEDQGAKSEQRDVQVISKENFAFTAPMDQAEKRISKKPFGMFITPETSSVQPDKFYGFHTGTDWEIFPEEMDADVPVRAVCSGTMRLKKYVSGYGGVVVEECKFSDETITVVYGHLNLESVKNDQGDPVKVGEVIGLLGANKSAQTDGERKHLHLSIHRGTSINLRGYVDSKSNLSDWIDPCASGCCGQ